MNITPQRASLLDRAIIGTLLFLASLLIGIQVAKATETSSSTTIVTESPAVTS